MRPQFDADYIRSEVERVGTHLDTPLAVYLIGGGAMALKDLKNATKDIDLIVTSSSALRRLESVLQRLDYEPVRRKTTEYEALGAQTILENDAACRMDLFDRQVVDKLVLSEGIRSRSEQYLDTGALDVRLVSSEDIFLFKAVAGRTDDVEDMWALMQTGIDFSNVEAELQSQIEVLGQELFVTYVNEALAELHDRFDVSTPLDDTVAEITHRVYAELDVSQALDEPKTVTELVDEGNRSRDEIEAILDRLETKGAVDIQNGRVERTSKTI